MNRQRGRVITHFANRHFGFILRPDGTTVFFHDSNYNGEPKLSEAVEFDLAPPAREGLSPMAVDIEPIVKTATPESEVRS